MKPQLACRPIISSINAPSFRLSDLVLEILKKGYNQEDISYYVEDSLKFERFINHFQLPEQYVIVKLDVVSLFTNTSVELCKDCKEKNLRMLL